MTKAVVLLSGGLDSATTLAIAHSSGYECFALSIDYGQRHVSELAAAAKLVESVGARDHKVVEVDLSTFGGSALTDPSRVVPAQGIKPGIPVTYVPAEIPLCCLLRSPGQKYLRVVIFLSGSTRWTIPAIPIAGPNT